MIGLAIDLELEDRAWENEGPFLPGRMARIERVGVLPEATGNGLPCVELLIRLSDGRAVVAETTLALFQTAAAAIAARWGQP